MSKSVLFILLLLSCCSFAFSQQSTTTQLFEKYLLTEDSATGEKIIHSSDAVSALFCQAVMTGILGEKVILLSAFLDHKPSIGLYEARLKRGIAYEKLEQFDSSIIDFSAAIQLRPNDAFPYYFRGCSLRNENNSSKAIEDFTKSISLDSTFFLSYYMRGLTYHDTGNFNEAISDFTVVIRLNREYFDALLMRGISYKDDKQYDLAIRDWQLYLKFDQSRSELVNSMIDNARKAAGKK